MAKAKRKKQRAIVDHDLPIAQSAGRDIQRAGRGYRFAPMIDTMHRTGQLCESDWIALSYYRDQAAIADRSPVKSCLDNSISGGGDIGPSVTILSAQLETARIERDMGQLWKLARRVAVDDWSLSRWCIEKHGGRDEYDSATKRTVIRPIGKTRVMAEALMELRTAARRIVR